jgi:glycosyltransferase involved in cell wall biosynthesis
VSVATQPRLLLHAPNVNQGGGLVLLKALLKSCPRGIAVAFLDTRARDALPTSCADEVVWVRPTVASRLAAEFALRSRSRAGDEVVCLHSQPPLFANGSSRLTVFVQNRHVLGRGPIASYGWSIRLRLAVEAALLRRHAREVDAFFVQTPSMARELRESLQLKDAEKPTVDVLPFTEPFSATARLQPEHDFIYPADSLAHKNHGVLLQAWIELARRGVKPSLLLTLEPSSPLGREFARAAQEYSLRIECVGFVSHKALCELYSCTRALVYPSLSESFGLPLVEASAMGLDIVASELDYVRDVCQPDQTFNPASSVSLCRALLRYLGQAEAPGCIARPEEFWRRVLLA